MTFPDLPSSKDGDKPGVSNTVSLEQLLSVRQKVSPHPGEAVGCATASQAPAEASVIREGQEHFTKPLILVVHEAQVCASCVKTKLHDVASEVDFQWASLEARVLEQVHRVQPYAVVIQFASNALDMAAALAKQLQQSQPHLPVFALGSTREPQSMLFALRAGVQECRIF